MKYLCGSCLHEYDSNELIRCPYCDAALILQCCNEDTRFTDYDRPDFQKREIVLDDGARATANFLQVNTAGSQFNRPEINHFQGKVFHNLPKLTSLHRDALQSQVDAIELSASAGHKVRLTNWRKPVFEAVKRHGDFAPHMVRAFSNICERKDYFTALHELQKADERLRRNGVRYTRNDEEIKELAKAKSRKFFKVLTPIKDVNERFHKGCELIQDLGLSFRPALIEHAEKMGELESLCNRICDENWLRRQMRRVYFSEVEAVARDLALVHKSLDAYCSSRTVDVMKQRQSDTELALINTVCYLPEDTNTWFTLQEMAAKSVSNPAIRRAEMFVRLKAFEEICIDSGHVAMFYTVTAPSRFHVYTSGDELNPKWLEAGKPSVNKAHHHLMKVSADFGRAISNRSIKIYGLRVVEPHHDGTPHHHYLYFMRKQDEPVVTDLLRSYALNDSPDETGASKYRFKSEPIDFTKGSAVGYVAKYLSKNIDGAHIQSDKSTDEFGQSGTGKSGVDAASSVTSFARVNGVRQFQFIGGPSVTMWREFRRLRDEFKEDDALILGNVLSKDEHFVLETLRKAADEGDFKTFVIAMGGVFVRRKDQSARPAYAKKIDVAGLVRKTKYGDEIASCIDGFMFRDKYFKTRFKVWRFAAKKNFIRGVRMIMKGTKLVFDSLEEENEYWCMKAEEYEQMANEAAFYFENGPADSGYLYDGDFYSSDFPPDWLQDGGEALGLESSGGPWTCVNNSLIH